eukprot:14316-Heterococcus_DN1.PRE.1
MRPAICELSQRCLSLGSSCRSCLTAVLAVTMITALWHYSSRRTLRSLYCMNDVTTCMTTA